MLPNNSAFLTPSQSLRQLSLLVSQETPFCQWHPELKNATQAVQVSRIPISTQRSMEEPAGI